MTRTYVVIRPRAWMNETGSGVHYYSDGVQCPSLAYARQLGVIVFGDDDFNIGIVEGRQRLVDVTWMGKPLEGIEDDMAAHRESVARIAREIGLMP